MGQHAEARKTHEPKIAKLRSEIGSLDQRGAEQQRLAAEKTQRSEKLAADAVAGKRTAFSEQVDLASEITDHRRHAKNFEDVAAPLRQQLAAAEAALPRFILAESIELLLEQTPEFEELWKQISETAEKFAELVGECKTRSLAFVATARPVLGDADIQRLATPIQRAVNEGARAQLHKECSPKGIVLFGSLAGADFKSVMRPRLENLVHTLEIRLGTLAGTASAGRAFFRARTNVSGLLGRNVKAGETVSLPIGDVEVEKMLKLGAIERVTDGKAVGV